MDWFDAVSSAALGASVVALAGALFGIVASFIARQRAHADLRRVEDPADETGPQLLLDQKIEIVATMSEQLSRLNTEIKEDFALQLEEINRLATQRDQLIKSIAEATEIAKIEQRAADAVNARITRGFEDRSTKDRRLAIGLAIAGFILGSGVTYAVSWYFFQLALQAAVR